MYMYLAHFMWIYLGRSILLLISGMKTPVSCVAASSLLQFSNTGYGQILKTAYADLLCAKAYTIL